jgi:hypothetical protein
MLSIAGFIVFLAGGALAYAAEARKTREKRFELIAGFLLMAGLAMLGVDLQMALTAAFHD